jgi:hypothetical protein
MHVAISYGAVTVAVAAQIGGDVFKVDATEIVRDLFGNLHDLLELQIAKNGVARGD